VFRPRKDGPNNGKAYGGVEAQGNDYQKFLPAGYRRSCWFRGGHLCAFGGVENCWRLTSFFDLCRSFGQGLWNWPRDRLGGESKMYWVRRLLILEGINACLWGRTVMWYNSDFKLSKRVAWHKNPRDVLAVWPVSNFSLTPTRSPSLRRTLHTFPEIVRRNI